ncbi:hypothetical protein T4D_7770 [Trichinella pseudospiralis]|uniref:Uncharacterized protein n=1 Tax=Trichinella pseudospiralis TaxID=6337 RepID=A0A0V1FFV8_TRIPS|nr:hypothetical protein T4D_7770 [Trichinella pseudospiralis]
MDDAMLTNRMQILLEYFHIYHHSDGYLLIENIIKVFLYIDGIYKAVPIRVVHLSTGQLCFPFSCSFEVAYVLRKSISIMKLFN